MTVPDGGITVAIIVGIGGHLLKALEQAEGVAIDRRALASRHSGGQGREDGKKGLRGKHFEVSSRTEEGDRDMDNYDADDDGIPAGECSGFICWRREPHCDYSQPRMPVPNKGPNYG